MQIAASGFAFLAMTLEKMSLRTKRSAVRQSPHSGDCPFCLTQKKSSSVPGWDGDAGDPCGVGAAPGSGDPAATEGGKFIDVRSRIILVRSRMNDADCRVRLRLSRNDNGKDVIANEAQRSAAISSPR